MGDGKTPLTVTSDSQRAEFALYEGDQADPGKLVDTFRVRLDGTFESADLDAGTYTIVETKAPDGYTLDSTPITFTVTAKQITNLDETEATKVINQAKGNLEFTKKGDSQNGSPVLNTAVFQLYDENKQPVGDPGDQREKRRLPLGRLRCRNLLYPGNSGPRRLLPGRYLV